MSPHLGFILWNTIMHPKYQKELSPTDSGLQNMTAFLCVLLSVFFSFHHFSEASPQEAVHR